MSLAIIWLIVVAVMLVVEIFTMGLTTIWFSFGAVLAAVSVAFDAPFWVQMLLFSAGSVITMVLIRPLAVRFQKKAHTKTNVDELVGKQVTVLEAIDNQKETGRVRINDVEWLARSVENVVIEAGKTVTIEAVSGVKLLVKNN